MAIVLELVNRSGHVLEHRSFDKTELSIGRAYDNDFIIHDPHSDPYHLRIVAVEGEGFQCEDLQSLNGTEWENAAGKKHPLSSSQYLQSGELLCFGKSLIRVKSSTHSVPSAIPLSIWELASQYLTRWWLLLLLILSVLGLGTLNEYFNQPQAEKYREHFLASLYALFAVAIYSGIWALIGRNLKHDGRFFVHVSLSLGFVCVLLLFSLSEPLLLFNTGITRQESFVGIVFLAAIIFITILASLHYATFLKGLACLLVAAIVPAGFILSVTVNKIKEPEFRNRPPYNTVLVSPFWQWRDGQEVETFLKESAKAYRQTD